MTCFAQSARTRFAGLALVLLASLLAGCSPTRIFGRPNDYQALAGSVVDSLSHDRYDLMRDLIVTNADMRRMGEEVDGPQDEPYPDAEEAVRDSFEKIRAAGAEAGVIWRDVRLSSASAPSAKNKFKELVDVKVTIDSRGNRYDLMIKKAQMTDTGEIVLTDRIQWLGER